MNCFAPGAFGQRLLRERRTLLSLIVDQAFVRSTTERPLYANGGGPAPWMLDTLRLTLVPEHARLAARCLRPLLESFSSRQLATYGSTALPLLQACTLELGSPARGLLIRKERKPHGAFKLVEGPLDRSQPVVLVDDTLATGASMLSAIAALAEEGVQVEGAVCLVRYGSGGFHRVESAGVRVEALFDLDDDVMPLLPEGRDLGPLNPSKWERWPSWGPSAPERLAPTALARHALETYLTDGVMLTPPQTLQGRHDARGGVWVSLRSKRDIHQRLAREGYWNFPGEAQWSAQEGIIRAAVQTGARVAEKGYGVAALEHLAIAVTFFGPLLESRLADIDNARHGLVVRSRARLRQMGGALPNMPGIANAFEEFRHAHTRNAGLFEGEPYLLYRHSVSKDVEPGIEWQPAGVPAKDRSPFSERALTALAAKARQLVLGRPVDGALPRFPEARQAYLSLFVDGQLRGCVGTDLEAGALDGPLRELARGVWADARFSGARKKGAIAVTVSLLSNEFVTGIADPEFVSKPFLFGKQCLEVHQGDRRATLLPSVPLRFDSSPLEYAEEIVHKAGIEQGEQLWKRFDCVSAFADSTRATLLVDGLPEGRSESSFSVLRRRLLKHARSYLKAHHVSKGPVPATYQPFLDRHWGTLEPERLAFVAYQKARLGLRTEAMDDVKRLGEASLQAGAFELLTRLALGDAGRRSTALALKLLEAIDAHGRFEVGDSAHESAFDYVPGQALLALAAALRHRLVADAYAIVPVALDWCWRRFQLNHSHGAAPWLMQAFVAFGRVEQAQAIAAEVLTFQSKLDGAFLTGQQEDCPGCTSICPLEGLAAVAAATKDARLSRAVERGARFIDRLVYQEKDVPLLPNPVKALGGLRQSFVSGQVRLDFTAHLVNFLLALPGRAR